MDRQAGPSTVIVAPETNSSTTRVTKSGKTLRYDLRIIQQPERARACGAGAKASSDRRPVDPPPILQLQIFEILPNGQENDVTNTMHATYFVYAMLDRTRQMAQPRNMADVGKVTVMTGSSVAGMQPFDRPTPAIYFLFPDLSVRHEGRYRLLFSLYEKIRSMDDDDRLTDPNAASSINATSAYIHRMDVKSIPFDVYSAKRFPGLSESTALSRTFAEQGSRIRIRRDVRMRRRDNKQGKDWDEFDDDNSQINRMSQTPDPYSQQIRSQQIDPVARPRSSSNHTQQSMQAPPSRRTSLNDLSQTYSQHGSFSQPAYNPSPSQPYTQASFMHPPPPQFQQSGYSGQMGMSAQPNVNYYGYVQQPGMTAQSQQSQYPPISSSFDASAYQTRGFSDFPGFSNDRRGSVQSSVASSSSQQLFSPHSTTSHSQMSFPPQTAQTMPLEQMQQTPHMTTQAPPETMQPPTKIASPSTHNKTNFTTTLPPLSTSFGAQSASNKLEVSPSSTIAGSAYTTALPTPTESHKRSYGSSFPTQWQNLSNKQGARPNDTIPASMFLAADGENEDMADPTDSIKRFYRRAGGRTVERQIP